VLRLRVPLAEVVEQHRLARRRGGQQIAGRRGTEVPQRPEPEPVARHGPQLPSHGLHQRPPARLVAAHHAAHHVQRDRVDGGEPTDGPGEVHPVEHVLAPVALQVDGHPVAASPPGQRPGQRRQQHVVDAGAVHRGCSAQQRCGVLVVELHHHGLGGAAGAGFRPVHRQGEDLGRGRPVLELVVEPAGGHVLLEPLGPVAERGGLGPEIDVVAVEALPVGRLEVVEQDPPGHPVDHQVVRRQEQRAAAPAEHEQHRLHQGAPAQVEARVDGVGDLLHRGGLPLRGQLGQVAPLQHLHRSTGAQYCRHVPSTSSNRIRSASWCTSSASSAAARAGSSRSSVSSTRVDWLKWCRRLRGAEEPVLDRREPHRSDDRFPVRGPGCGRGDGGRERGDRLVPEHVLRAERQPGLAGPGGDLDAQDRVAAEVEEVVLDPHPLDPEDALPDLGQGDLHRARGRHVGGAGDREGVQRAQRAPVDLPVPGQRQLVEHGEGRGHHVLGQAALQPGPQVRPGRGARAAGDDVGLQPLVTAGVRPGHDHGLGHVGVAGPARPRSRRARSGSRGS
jgi:hypothetical protein